MHMNQRVVSAKVEFTQFDVNVQKYEPTVSIDGELYKPNDNLGPMEQITITRAFKYQHDENHKETAKTKLEDGIKKKYPDCEDPTIFGK